uniref:Uncharacterized protein n=1 Tax=Timema bartmani TaxID=61472 RepID=A0A7R9F3X4_9NEOP|nr:unnamed protein product [Timema bartmani]
MMTTTSFKFYTHARTYKNSGKPFRLSSRIQAIINTQKEHGNSSELNVKHELEESHVISDEDEDEDDNKPLKHSKKQARIASESSEVIEEPELIVPLPKKRSGRKIGTFLHPLAAMTSLLAMPHVKVVMSSVIWGLSTGQFNRAICGSTNMDHPGSTIRVLCRLSPNTAWPITLSQLAPHCPAHPRAIILIRGRNG